jgi:hypothetical protein
MSLMVTQVRPVADAGTDTRGVTVAMNWPLEPLSSIR